MAAPARSANSRVWDVEAFGGLAPLRQALVAAGYNQDALAETTNVRQPGENMDLQVLIRRTAPITDYHTCCRLFYLGQAVPEAQVRASLAPMALEPLLAGGLLRATPLGLRATAKITPFEDGYFVSDFIYPVCADPLPSDHVLGVGAASVTLSVLTVRKPVATAFDLGCGAGVQSLRAARHARTVVGTDINDRALSFAAFNARLNGIENVEWRNGSFFEPVRDETFDLIVANPPFVISPESGLLYRDGGLGGDAVSETVVRGVAQKLNAGGYGTMLINWYHQNDDDWEERPRAWLAHSGCDAWLIRSVDSSPLAYAASWLRFNEARNPDRYGQLLDEWLAYFTRMGMKRIGAGGLILRKRPAAANWLRCDTLDNVQGKGQCSDAIERVFAAEDRLQQLGSDSELLSEYLVLHPDVCVEQSLVPGDEGWQSETLRLSLRQGFPFSGNADVHVLRMLGECNGKRPLRDLIQSVADRLKVPFDKVAPVCLAVAKKMVRSGMLTFASAPAA